MSVRTDVINLNVNINGNVAQNQLNDLRKKAADLSFEMKNGLKKGTQEYIDKASELRKVTAEMNDLKKSIGITSLSLRELNAEAHKLTSLRNAAGPLSKEFKDYDNQLQKVIARQNELKGHVQGLGGVFSSVKQNIGALVASYIGFQAVVQGTKALITGAIKLSDQLGDLRRVAGLTADEASNLNKKLLEIDTRTSGAGLLSIAIIAGKLGVAKGDIFSFTEAVNKLVVTLGDELGDADNITTQLGKILNVFDGKVTGDNISFLGNAIVDLANKGVATGAFIVDFTQRVSGIAKASNLSLGATVGLAAGFESLGLRSESSSSALQKILSTIAVDIPKAARVAGVPLKEFNELFAKSPQDALIKYAEGLTKNEKSFPEITASFKDAGEEGIRVAQTLQAIGQNGKFLSEQIDIGNKSIKEQTALNEGYAIKNDNLAGSIEKLRKVFDKLAANEGVQKFLKGITNLLSSAITEVDGLATAFNKMSEDGAGKVFSRVGQGLAELLLHGPEGLKKLNEMRKAADEAAIAFKKAQHEGTAIQSQNGTPLFLPADTVDPNAKKADSNASLIKETAKKERNAEYDRLKKEAADFYKCLQKLKEDVDNASKTQDEKDLIELKQKYDDLHAKALDFLRKNVTDRKTYTEEEKLIVEAFNKDLAALQQKQFDKNSDEEYAKSLKASDEYFATLKRNVERQYAEGKIGKDDYEAALSEIESRAVKNRIGIANDYFLTAKKAPEDLKKFTIDQEEQITRNLEKQKELRIAILQDEGQARRDIRNIQINDPATPPSLRNKLQKQNAEDDKTSGLNDLKSRLKEAGVAYDDATVNATDEGKKIWLQYAEDIKKADLTLREAQIENQQWWANEALSLTSNLMDALDNLDQRALQKEKIKNDAKKNLYKKELDDKLLSQKQYDIKVAAADAEMDKKKHEADVKAFKRKQALGIAEALINGALAIEKTYAEFGFPVGIPFAVAMGLVTLAQVAAIATQAAPEAAEGNWFRKGDKHKDPSGGIPVMIERDEAVVKADAMTDPKTYTITGTPSQITSKLNSMHGGVNWSTGARLIVPKFREPAPQINSNLPRIMARGGIVSPLNYGIDSISSDQLSDLLRQLLAKQDEMISVTKDKRDKLQAEVSLKDFRRKEIIYDNAKKASGMSQ